MRFPVITALIAIACGFTSYAAATRAGNDTFLSVWFAGGALVLGIGFFVAALASATRVLFLAGQADEESAADAKRLENVRAKMIADQGDVGE